MSVDIVPKDLKNLRACLVCSLIKVNIRVAARDRLRVITERTMHGEWFFAPDAISHKEKQTSSNQNAKIIKKIYEENMPRTMDQFEYDGCDNCDEFLRMKNNRENIYDCTSSNFDGMIALMSPEDSWVAKWQRINRFVKGVYAISVAGRLPPHVIRDMKNRGIIYRPRDTSQR